MLSSSLAFRFSVGAAFGLSLFIWTINSARSEVKPAVTNSLFTHVNGRLDGSCSSGICKITGGTSSGRNLFHRFKAFDTRGGIEGVEFDSVGKDNLIIAVTAPKGSFIDKSIGLSSSANLFWLSPGGIHLDQHLTMRQEEDWMIDLGSMMYLAQKVAPPLQPGPVRLPSTRIEQRSIPDQNPVFEGTNSIDSDSDAAETDAKPWPLTPPAWSPNLVGDEFFTDEQLHNIFKICRRESVAKTLNNCAAQLTALLVSEGYINSRIYVVRKPEPGALEVVLGRISEVNITTQN